MHLDCGGQTLNTLQTPRTLKRLRTGPQRCSSSLAGHQKVAHRCKGGIRASPAVAEPLVAPEVSPIDRHLSNTVTVDLGDR